LEQEQQDTILGKDDYSPGLVEVRGKKILLIGYSVFSGFQLNPSEEIITRLDGADINGYRVEGLLLPVSYRYVQGTLPRILEEEQPDIALGIGLAPRATRPVIELVASNVASFRISDDGGALVGYEYVAGSGLEAVRTTLPVSSILDECRRRGLDIVAGVSIGTYLCGIAGYYIMKYAETHKRIGGFIHIPPSTELAMRHGLRNYVSLSILLEIIKCVLETVTGALQASQQSSQ